MILSVRVIPGANRNRVIEDNKNFSRHRRDAALAAKVYLTKPAQDGLANQQLLDLLSEHLNLKKYQIKIIKGHKSRNKLIEINA